MSVDLTNLAVPQYNFVIDKSKSLILESVAGSGKSFTLENKIVYSIENKLIDTSKTIILAFNKIIQQEWDAKKLGITASTTHSIAFKILRSLIQVGVILPEKQKLILKKLEKEHDVKLDAKVKSALYNMKRRTLFNKHSRVELIEMLNKECIKNGGEWGYGTILWEAWCESLNNLRESIDYDDMLYAPLELLEKDPFLKSKIKLQYDLIIVDEMQDLNWAQIQIMKLLKPNDIWCAGDSCQGVNQFNGANHKFIKDFASELGAKEMRLNETRRCSKAVVDFVNQTCLEDFKAAPSCKTGYVNSDQKSPVINAPLNSSTVIVARWNNILISIGLHLLLNGIPFNYRKSIAEDVSRFLKKIDKNHVSLREANRQASHKMKARERELNEHNVTMTQYEKDMWDCCLHLTDRSFQSKFDNLGDLIKSVKKMGKDKSKDAIQLSTVHAAKGLEWEHVIFPENIALMEAFKKVGTDMPDNVEKNIYYVALTRSKNTLHLRTKNACIDWINKNGIT